MEVCGTHTVSVFRSGLRAMLPACIRLVSGPGCPVCVTAQRHIDAAIELATRERVVIATYGDMLRVPGRLGSLESVRARGATVRVVNSARTALSLARELPDAQVVFLAVGFETTAPATAATVLDANYNGVENFSVLMCHKLIVPAMLALLSAGDAPPARDRPDAGQGLDGFIGPGHVSVIIGSDAYRPVVEQHHKPVVVAGFEPNQILHAIIRLIGQIVGGRAEVENVYERVVRRDGNRVALGLLNRVFEAADAPWRELGVIAGSGFELRRPFRRFDALRRFGVRLGEDVDDPACRCGEVICGRAEPAECALFDNGCSPLTPIGPCMVSSEGTCAAWYKYNRRMAGVRS
jgi:hydrogenase expression/formation protein HypD